MAKKYGQWKGSGGLTPPDRRPRQPRQKAYNQPEKVGETVRRRRQGTKRWSFIVKTRKPPERGLRVPSHQERMKRKSVQARYIRAQLLEPIRLNELPPFDLLYQWQLPELSRLLPPLFDRITDPGARRWPFPIWTFEGDGDPAMRPTVFMMPKIAIRPPELTSAFLPNMEPMVMPARPAPISPEIHPFEPVEVDIQEPDYEPPTPRPAPAWIEPIDQPHPSYEPPDRLEYPERRPPTTPPAPVYVAPEPPIAPTRQQTVTPDAPQYVEPSITSAPTYQPPDLERREPVLDLTEFPREEFEYDPPWVISHVRDWGPIVRWYRLDTWKRTSWVEVYVREGEFMRKIYENERVVEATPDSATIRNIYAEVMALEQRR